MNEAMRQLFFYTLDTGFHANLQTDQFRLGQLEADQLFKSLQKELPDGSQSLLDNYLDALDKQQHLELEAMFQAAFSLAKELL